MPARSPLCHQTKIKMETGIISRRLNGTTGSTKKNPTLLVVDDEPALRLLLNEFFKDKFKVQTMNDGQSCLGYLERETPEALILDLNMPDMSGLDVIKKIRSNPEFFDLAIIVLSGAESSIDRINCLEAGADDFVVKPFNPRELSARIKAISRRMHRIL